MVLNVVGSNPIGHPKKSLATFRCEGFLLCREKNLSLSYTRCSFISACCIVKAFDLLIYSYLT